MTICCFDVSVVYVNFHAINQKKGYLFQRSISQPKENAKSTVELNDVAYWPTGKAICLFYGPTPIDNPDEITPASSVNVIGKIISPDKTILNDVHGECATFVLRS